MRATLLIADDDHSICTVLSHAAARKGWDARVVHDGQSLLALAEQGIGDVVITDVRMPVGDAGKDGLDVLPALARIRPELPVIVISAQNSLMTAVRANQVGAYEYLPKPFDLPKAVELIRRAVDESVREDVSDERMTQMPEMLGQAPAMQDVFRAIGRLSQSNVTVLITGESGTGKEVIAKVIHRSGSRKDKPFIAINCSAIPENLLESELFGYVKGAFTGASDKKLGLFEEAQGGTLFLDEIGDLSLPLQAKLLRVLQEKQVKRLGENQIRDIDSKMRRIREALGES